MGGEALDGDAAAVEGTAELPTIDDARRVEVVRVAEDSAPVKAAEADVGTAAEDPMAEDALRMLTVLDAETVAPEVGTAALLPTTLERTRLDGDTEALAD